MIQEGPCQWIQKFSNLVRNLLELRALGGSKKSCQSVNDPLICCQEDLQLPDLCSRSCKTEALKSRFKLYMNNRLLSRHISMCFPFQKQAEKEELLHVKMATALLCGVASDNSWPDFIATEDNIMDHRAVLFSEVLAPHLPGLKGSEGKMQHLSQRWALNPTAVPWHSSTASLHSLSLTFPPLPGDKPPSEVTPAEAPHASERGGQREGTMKPADPCSVRCPLRRRPGQLSPITTTLTGGSCRDPAGESRALPRIVVVAKARLWRPGRGSHGRAGRG